MIKRTKEEIEAKIEELWPAGESYEKTKVLVTIYDNEVEIEICRMYEYVSVNLSNLMTLAEFFGTKNINDSRYSYPGCDTCDYGSSYEVTLTVRPE